MIEIWSYELVVGYARSEGSPLVERSGSIGSASAG